MADIHEQTLEHLLQLSRIDPDMPAERKEKLIRDLSKILDHFTELQEVPTDDLEPLAGGGFLSNAHRVDEERVVSDEEREKQRELSIRQFPDHENGYLKVPPIF